MKIDMKCLSNMVRKLLKFHRLNRDNKGYALPMVLVMLSLLMVTSIYLVNRNLKEMEANQKSLDYEICILTAKNGMEEIKAIFNRQEAIVGNAEDPNGGHYSYRLLKVGENDYEGELISWYRQYEKCFFIKIECDPEKEMRIENFFWEME